MTGQPFFSDLVKTVSSTEELISKVFAIDKKSNILNVDTLKEKAGSKSEMASWIIKLTAQLQKNVTIMEQAISEVDLARQESKSSLKRVNELQKKLLDSDKTQENNIRVMECVVEEKMQSTMKQYSDVIKATASPPEPAVTISKIKHAVRQVINTGDLDRSKNVIVFGLQELADENIMQQTENILASINLKPKISSAKRFGRKQDDKPRPVRVTFQTTETVHGVLKFSKSLKSIHDYRNVYISIDRSEEQQARHSQLVKELKKNITESPNKHWYIKNDMVNCSEDTAQITEISQSRKTSDKTPSKVSNVPPPIARHSDCSVNDDSDNDSEFLHYAKNLD